MHTTPLPAPTAALPVAPHLVDLAEDARRSGSPSAFQAMLAAVRCAVQRVQRSAATARPAAISLAQHERLDALRAALDTYDAALDGVLDAPGRCLLDAAPAEPTAARSRMRLWHRKPTSPQTPPPSWSAAVTGLLATLDAQIDNLARLASGQPADAPSRVLGDEAVVLLSHHRDALRADARRWAA